jgi:hypothetical protein
LIPEVGLPLSIDKTRGRVTCNISKESEQENYGCNFYTCCGNRRSYGNFSMALMLNNFYRRSL